VRTAKPVVFTALNAANVAVNTVDSNRLGGPPRLWGAGAMLTMQQVAERTGGQAYYHRNDLDGAIAEGIAAARDSYTLGFNRVPSARLRRNAATLFLQEIGSPQNPANGGTPDLQ